jgi:hypothetical protein
MHWVTACHIRLTISTIERQLLSKSMRCSHPSAAESQRQELWMHRLLWHRVCSTIKTVITESARFSECVHVARTSQSLKHSTAAGAQGVSRHLITFKQQCVRT